MYHLDVARWVKFIFFCNKALKQLIYEWYCYLKKIINNPISSSSISKINKKLMIWKIQYFLRMENLQLYL